MKVFIITFLSLLLINISWSQNCEGLTITYDSTQLRELYSISENRTLEVTIKFDNKNQSQVYIKAIQVMGIRPVASPHRYELTKSGKISIPIKHMHSETMKQALYLVVTDSEEENKKSFSKTNSCIKDTIPIQRSLIDKKYFWKEGVQVTYSVYLDNKKVSVNQIKVLESNADATKQDKVIMSSSANLKLTLAIPIDKRRIIMPCYATLKSNNDSVRFDIYKGLFLILQNLLENV